MGLSFSQADLGDEFFSGRSWPKIGPGIILSGFLKSFETFFSIICAHSERYRNLWAGIFEILTFYGNIGFPLSPVFIVVGKIETCFSKI